MQTLVLNSLEDLQELYDGVAEDFNKLDYTEWMKAELVKLADWEQSLFDTATAPDGAAWPPLAPSTIKRKGHATILVDTTRLRRSLTFKGTASNDEAVREANQTDTAAYLAFGSLVPYGPSHDESVGNRPARRHVGINEQYLDKMVERVADYTVKELAEA
jgi:phage gpG-like protein